MKKRPKDFGPFLLVRMKGIEPPRLAAPDPKSGASTNFATSAKVHTKVGPIGNF
jgi:hypothetical protein